MNLSELKEELRARENKSMRKFTLYTSLMVILGISISIWSVMEGIRAKRFQMESELSQKRIDSLEARIIRANDLLVAQKEKLMNNQMISGHIRIGLDNFYSKKYEMAVNEYNQAIELDPDNFVLYDLRGYSQLRLNQINEAIISLQKSVELNKSYGWGYYNLSLAYWAHGEKLETKETVKKLLDISPGFKKIILNDFQFQQILKEPDIYKLLYP